MDYHNVPFSLLNAWYILHKFGTNAICVHCYFLYILFQVGSALKFDFLQYMDPFKSKIPADHLNSMADGVVIRIKTLLNELPCFYMVAIFL